MAACFALYGNTIPNGYSIDDETVTRGHHATSRGVAAIPEIFSTSHINFAGQEFDYRPVTLATFALEHQLFGENPHVGHFFNVLLYAITAIVLFTFLESVFGPHATLFSLTAATFFIVHPIHTEVVASLKSRDEILALLFGLISALLFSRYFDRKRLRHAAGGLLALTLALMSKLSALPFVLLIPLSLAFSNPARRRPAILLACVLVGGALAYGAAVLSFIPRLVPVPTFVENPLVAENDSLVIVGTSLDSLLFYLQKLLIPYPLNFYYGYDTIDVASTLSARAGLSLVIYLALVLYAVRYARAANAAVFGIAWFLVAIAPYSNLLAPVKGIVAERSAYLASVGFSVALAYAVFRIAGVDARSNGGSETRRRVTVAAAALLVLANTMLTWNRNRAWADSFTLYEADIGRQRTSVMAHLIYSRQLRREFGPALPSDERTEKLEYAIALSQRALRILPSDAAAHEHIGAIYLYDLGEPAKALPYLGRASDLAPRYTLAHYDALYCSVLLRQFDGALKFGERLLRHDPGHVMGLFFMSKLHFTRGEVDKAFEDNARLAQLAPDRDLAYLNYGYFYYERSDMERAIENFEKALTLEPANPAVIHDLIGILTDHGDVEKARRYEKLARQLEAEPLRRQPPAGGPAREREQHDRENDDVGEVPQDEPQ